MTTERKGLRFEVSTTDPKAAAPYPAWSWVLIGADGPVCKSVEYFWTEPEVRSNIAAAKGRMKAARFAKTVTVNE